MNYINVRNGMVIGFLAAGFGACIGQRVGFKKVDNALMKVFNSENGGTKTIKGIKYHIEVIKK